MIIYIYVYQKDGCIKSRMKGDFHVRFCEKLGLQCPCLLDPVLPAGVLVHRGCKPLSLLSFTVIVVLVCAVAYFLFSEGEEIFFNSILSAWERWKLFCKLWSVLGLVRLANVLTPVRWLSLYLILCIS